MLKRGGYGQFYERFLRLLESRQIERFYSQAVQDYQAGDYERAIGTLAQASALNPDVTRVNLLQGWCYWRLGQPQQAEIYFTRALRLDASVEQAKLGLAYASLALQKTTVALPLFQELAQKHPEDNEIQLALGEAYVQSGQNLAAALIFRAALQRNPEDQAVQREFLRLYGYPSYRPDLPLTSSIFQRPELPETYFRTRGDVFQVRVGKEWRNLYSVGVNLGPARPGEFPSTASGGYATYLEWLQQIAAMNANTVRLYTILPPAFYQAFKAYNETARSPLWLIQEVWIKDGAVNLYDPATEQGFQTEITRTIDLLHGQADVPYQRGHHNGIYTADVSRHVLALALGQEVEPRLALVTNRNNASVTSYKGQYVSLASGSPTEAWFARMCDFAARYEVDKYNAQRPLTVVNWPPLDPLHHPTEATYEEELEIRRKLGEVFEEATVAIPNDSDIVSLDVTKFRSEPGFAAGLFALYHVYPHWPDFLLYEPGYALAQDAEGDNRYLGYLRELKKAHRNFPLLIGEYGISSSLGVAHLHPQGWNNGGLTEKQQAELLVRFTRNIRETRCAGGLVFEWQDEWFKHVHDSNTGDFELPWDRGPLWMNAMDPEKNFGIVGYQPVTPVPLLRGKREDWESATALYSSENGAPRAGISPGDLQAVYAMSDFAYLYLRLDVASGAMDWNRWNYWIALNTLPGQSGSRLLPEIGIRVSSGANFLIQLASPFSARILIAENYNPNQRLAVAGRFGVTRMTRKIEMQVALADSVPFQEIVIEVNQPRYSRDGSIFPALEFNRSPLAFGTADRMEPEFSSHALWHHNPQQGLIELRIPWGLLLMMDPSNRQAFGGTDEHWVPVPQASTGISITAFALRIPETGNQGPKVVTSSLPPARDGNIVEQAPVYTWHGWSQVLVRPYFKEAYFALQKIFGDITKGSQGLSTAKPPLSSQRTM
ncbi:MAG: tetratricopeptide repeat protein [Acidobacteria bacterium]|nr:tetratricopeptide repeat protein [Acidobacteriota bacterium]